MTRKGYLDYSSRGTRYGIKRGTRAHRFIVEYLLNLHHDAMPGDPHWVTLSTEVQVHHQDSNKLNNCPSNLVLMPGTFNPSPALRCPYTGAWMNARAYYERYGQHLSSLDPRMNP